MKFGIDSSAIDPSIRPQDDLFGYVNGTWLANAEIPEDRSRYGAFDMLAEQSEQAMHEIISNAADAVKSDSVSTDTPIGRVGALFLSFMDTERIERLGWTPVAADFAGIAGVDGTAAFVAELARLERQGMSGLFGVYVAADAGAPDTEIAYLSQSGLGLPDREYYLDEAYSDTRAAYLAHLQRMFDLAKPTMNESGLDLGADAAERVLALETQIATAHWDKVETRDALKSYNKMTQAELAARTNGFDWSIWLDGIGAPPASFADLVVGQPDTIETVTALVESAPLADWRAWMTARLITFAAPYLPAEVSAANFDFYGRTLSGTPEQKVRWKRGVGLVESLLGDDGGQLYTERHYPAHAAERMEELVANVTAAFRARIEELEWMGPDTRAQALEKLDNFRAKIGKPPRWKDYSAFEVRPDDLFGNVKRGNAWETDFQIAKIGRPVDRDEWLMTPQTVNAYYHPLMNEIVFPAAILQPPFFDANAPDAINYGGIGAVIAHEIGHGFDDQGSRFDGTGTLRDWWTADDRTAFDQRAGALIEQFNTLSTRTVPDEKVNGALTVGENIGDLCGVELSFAALQIANRERASRAKNDGRPAEVAGQDESYEIADVTWNGDQLFFLNWAQLWRTLTRPEEARRLLATDPHSPPDLRANAVSNVDAFHDAFETSEGDQMWLDPNARVRVF